jgi:hypothetical protein
MQKRKLNIKPKKMTIRMQKSEYDTDFYKWTNAQAKLLKKRDFDSIDLDNLIEEIASLGRSDRRALKSHLENILLHMLKMEYQPQGKGNSKSWESSLFHARMRIKDLLDDSPSMKKLLPNLISKAYELAKYDAVIETGLSVETFPKECPWKRDEILDF